MRLITELCAERGLAAIINIHDVLLAQMYSQRVVGLELGTIVYDGPPDGLTPEVLTRIYGEEDWEATIENVDSEDEELEDVPIIAKAVVKKNVKPKAAPKRKAKAAAKPRAKAAGKG